MSLVKVMLVGSVVDIFSLKLRWAEGTLVSSELRVYYLRLHIIVSVSKIIHIHR